MRMRDIIILASASVAASLFTHGPGQLDNVRIISGALKSNILRSFTATDLRCGPGFGKCPDGKCCSTAGWCGNTEAYCRSPDCLIDFGKCDASKRPNGPPTSDIPRPHNGKAVYGPSIIGTCTVPGTVALTFDDGPNVYTEELLDLLDRYNAKATFFITGINNAKGPIDDPSLPWEPLILRMRDSGHQVASHTWSHQDLSAVSREQLREQMLRNEAALRNILGVFPTYMRPPYSRCGPENGCLEELGDLGYHIILFDIDTKDYSHDSPDQIQFSKDRFDSFLSSAKASVKSWLVIAHDVHEQTVRNLTEHMLKRILNDGYRPVTVGECLDDPQEFWYRKDSHTPPHHDYIKASKNISIDGTCGANFTCTGSTFGCQTDAGRCTRNRTHSGNHSKPRPTDPGFISNDEDETTSTEDKAETRHDKPKKNEAQSILDLGSTLLCLGLVLGGMVLVL
ncbi:chitin deacetylase [Aspergillus sclerotialis]|uniref:Chitin deacetylase n=1 Tax=Aspergillus sclerotialis TaxID=2070753 RepID=A0A3A2ZP04_9EURO|nr:chitin deacetylase [Aspergillus sclerotialis]